MEPGVGFEPTISALQVRCIATYAYPADVELVSGFEPEISPIPKECCANLSYTSIGAKEGNRNPDLRVTNAALFHLSYSGSTWSGRCDSNARRQPRRGCILATELRPHNLWSGAGGSNSYR